jgi:colanic acid biosynthesis glycosyl transferase WcaI
VRHLSPTEPEAVVVPLAPRTGAPAPHIVFVCLVFYPDTAASSILFTDLFRRLAESGFTVTVLCGFPTKDGPEGLDAVPRAEVYHGIRIVRCGPRLGKGTLVSRGLTYAGFLLDASRRIIRLRGATIVGGTDPPFTPIALWGLSLMARFGYEEIVLDLYPDGLVGLGSLRATSPVVRLWTTLNRRAFRHARRLIVIGRDTTERLVSHYGVDRARVAYIPHWATMEVEREPLPDGRRLLSNLGIADRFVVQYSGNMGLWHDIDTLVRAAEALRDDPRIHFLFIGKGMRRAGAEALASSLKLTNITWLDFLPREQLPESLVNCDAALISFRSGLEGTAVPSKLYGILASGRPVIAQVPAASEVAYTVEEERCGVVVPPGNAAALASAITTLAADRNATRAMGERARAAYEAKYTIQHATDAYAAMWGESS